MNRSPKPDDTGRQGSISRGTRNYKPDHKRSWLTLKIIMILLMSFLIFGMLTLLGSILHYFFTDTLEEQMGQRALSVAQSIATLPELKQAFGLENPAEVIQPLAENIRMATGAEFIVIGNEEEIRYAHPNPELIGARMVGEDNKRALLHGEAYISKAEGTLGLSIRGKVPITNDKGAIIGVVSVGFLMDEVQSFIRHYSMELWYVLLLISAMGLSGAMWIASYIKKKLYGLEPDEISELYLQKETILQSTHEGIIAVSKSGRITLINAAAQRLLFGPNHGPSEQKEWQDQPVLDVWPASDLMDVLEQGRGRYDQEMQLGDHTVYVNSMPIIFEGKVQGAVSTLRSKTEIERLSQELSEVKTYADTLRAQTHEFSNKMFTVLGLIQLDKKTEAIEFIKKERSLDEGWLQALIEKSMDPIVNAILYGKYIQANEQRVQMMIEPESSLTSSLPQEYQDVLVTVLGNLIENALEATRINRNSLRIVSVFFTDVGEEFIFEIDDSGSGVPEEQIMNIFRKNFSTKEGQARGIGLALVQEALLKVEGSIFLEKSKWGGACFVIALPKKKQRRAKHDEER